MSTIYLTETTTATHHTAETQWGARIRIYPDAAHAFLFQEPEQVAADIAAFLE